jgi:exodeoxyribonuclease-5
MEFLNKLWQTFPFEPTHGQAELAGKLQGFLAATEPMEAFILKGYAGTGKTSFISSMVRVLRENRQRTVLLAPTGRAAKVFSSYAGQQAFTIHKRIYFQRAARDGSISLVLQKNLFRNAIFFVDEASMIGAGQAERDLAFTSRNLLDDLIEYVYSGEGCKMILIGDTAQLPPVGMDGSPALDLEFLRSRYDLKLRHHELTEVMRQSLESGILSNATRLRDHIAENRKPEPLFKIGGFRDILRITGAELEETLQSAYSSGQPGETIVICRSNKRANLYNREIRNRVMYHDSEISAGDFLMVVRNNYFWLDPESGPGFIANGDIAEIMSLRHHEDLYGFRFADATIRLADYPAEQPFDVKLLLDVLMSDGPSLPDADQRRLFQSVIDDFQDIPQRSERLSKVRSSPYYNALQVKFAYALTCHKTQGGQWENVIIDQGYLPDERIDAEYLRWLYTALTRSQKQVFLAGFSEAHF